MNPFDSEYDSWRPNVRAEKSLGEVLTNFLKQNGTWDKIQEAKAVALWYEITGDMVAKQTKSAWFDSGALHISLKQPALKQEMLYLREQVRTKINKAIGEELVKEIIIR